jgi:predicted nucleotidyltransferase
VFFFVSVDKQELLDRLRKILDQPSIPFSVLHGSMAAGRETPVSDVDVAVYVEEQDRFLDLVVRLDEALPERRVDVTNLARQPSWIVYRVLATGETIHVADEALYHDVKFRAMREYLDFKPVHDRILQDMERRLERGRYGRAIE